VASATGDDNAPMDRVTYLGHSTVLLELAGVRLLTDPLLRRRVGPLARRSPVPTPDSIGALDAVLISHWHRDHLDLPSLRSLSKTSVIAPRGTRSLLERAGLERVTEVQVGDDVPIGDVRVSAVPAVHGGPRTPFARARATCLGYVVSGPTRIYFAGDTEVFAGMADLAPLDLALLPVWGWGPTLGPGHMSPAQAVEALSLLQPHVAVPIHWGTIFPVGLGSLNPGWLRDPPRAFARHAASSLSNTDVRVLELGEALDLAGQTCLDKARAWL
jgi:L-ascorbate metabolism protein UlaG (beta-lactamase superfamily)